MNALIMIVQKRGSVDMFLGSFDPIVVQDNEGEEMVNVFCLFVRLIKGKCCQVQFSHHRKNLKHVHFHLF